MITALFTQLARLRQAHGLTATQVAHAIGCRPATLHRWETGQASPSLADTVRWTNALGMDLHCAPARRRP